MWWRTRVLTPTQKNKKGYKKNVAGGARRQWTTVHKTETVMNNQHPTWRKFTLDINQLCVGNIDQAILLEVYDWGMRLRVLLLAMHYGWLMLRFSSSDSGGGHDLIGKAIASLRQLQMPNNEIILYNPKRAGVTNRAGVLFVCLSCPWLCCIALPSHFLLQAICCRPIAGAAPPVAAAVTTTTYAAPVAPQAYQQTTVTYQQPAYGYPPQPAYGAPPPGYGAAPGYGAPQYGYPPQPGYPPAPYGY